MKNILIPILSFYFLLSTFYSFGQVPQKFNYQGIARDTKGNPMAQQRMTLKLTVLPTADATIGEYEEIQTVTTNEFGLYTLQIGNGTPVNGEMKAVKWETGNKYIKVAIDPKGGNDFVDAGTNQLLSVPYAIYADKAGTAKNAGGGDRTGAVNSAASHLAGDANYLSKFTGFNLIGKSQLFDNGTNIGIGTTTPAARLHLYSNVAGVQQQIRMQNASTTGASRFRMDNNGTLSYATFSKYGTAYASGYPGIAALYPYANLLAFGNNGLAANDGLGRLLISNGGNIGISIFKGGTSKLKFHADYATENVGIGGNAVPVSRVHLNNTDGTSMDVRLTNTTTGHTATDGMTITMSGNNATINNRENSSLAFATNNTEQVRILANGNVGIGTSTPSQRLDVDGSINTSNALYVSNIKTIWYNGFGRTQFFGTDGMTTHMEFNGYNTHLQNKPVYIEQKLGIGLDPGTTPIFGLLDVEGNGNATDIFRFSNDTDATKDSSMVMNGNGNIGIGTSAPTAKLHVNGQFKLADGTEGNGKVLTSDSSGLASWSTPLNPTAIAPQAPDFSCMSIVGSTAPGGGKIRKVGNYAYVADGGTLKIFDISNPSAPVLTGSVGVNCGVFAVSGNYAFTGGYGDTNIHIINVSNPALPTIVGTIPVVNSDYTPVQLEVQGNFLYCFNNYFQLYGSLTIYNISNPATPTLAGNTGIWAESGPMVVSGNYLYLAENGGLAGDFQVYNVSNPASVSPTSGIYLASMYDKVEISGNYAYLTNYFGGMEIVNISNPGSLVSVSTLSLPSNPTSISISNGYAYITTSASLLQVNISNPAAPVFVGQLATGGLNYGVANGNYAYVVDGGSLKVVSLVCNSQVVMNNVTGQLEAQSLPWLSNGGNISNANNGNVGIGTSTPTQKLSVSGNICYTGSSAACSDVRYKKDITPLENSLQKVMSMNGVNYRWRVDEFKDKQFNHNLQIGFIAQEIEKIYPELVVTDVTGYKSVDYAKLTPILVEAIKELKAENNQLKKDNLSLHQHTNDKLMELEAKLNLLLNPPSTNTAQIK